MALFSSSAIVRTNGCSRESLLLYITEVRAQLHVVYSTACPPSLCRSSESRLCLTFRFKHSTNHSSQPFWGEMVATNSVGPPPIRHGALTVENLTDSIAFCLEPKTKSAADVVAARMKNERGVQGAARSFHKHLPRETYCHLTPEEAAAWTYKKHLRLSKRAASTLVKTCTIRPDSLASYVPAPQSYSN